jgi:hypothetical protein
VQICATLKSVKFFYCARKQKHAVQKCASKSTLKGASKVRRKA